MSKRNKQTATEPAIETLVESIETPETPLVQEGSEENTERVEKAAKSTANRTGLSAAVKAIFAATPDAKVSDIVKTLKETNPELNASYRPVFGVLKRLKATKTA